MKMMVILLLFITSVAFAAIPWEIPNNDMKFGDGTNSAKSLEMNMGLGINPIFSSTDGTGLNINIPFSVGGGLTAEGNMVAEGNMTLGDGTAVDRKLEVNRGGSNPFMKWSESAGAWVFSNDGTLEKKIGSGSGGGGGGINFLVNSSFEDPGSPILNWANTGGTLTQEDHVNGREANLKFARFVATGAGQYLESDAITISDDVGPGCMADFKYMQGDDSFEYKVLKSPYADPADVVSTGSLSDLTEFLKAPTITFPCKGGDLFKFRIVSTGAGTIDADEAYTGSNKNISPVGDSAHFVGSLQFKASGSAEVWNKVGTSYSSFTPTGTIPNPIEIGSVSYFGDNLPKLVLKERKVGVYKFVISSMTKFGGDGAYNHSIKMSNGVVDSTELAVGTASNSAYSGEMIYVSTDTASNETWEILGKSSGSDTISILTAYQDAIFSISVYFTPDSSQTQEAFTPEQSNFSANGVVVNFTGGNTDVPADGVPAASTYEMQNITGLANITCTDFSQGTTTCPSGNEQIGVELNIPTSGSYEVCFNSSVFAVNGGQANLRIGHYQNKSDTLISLGSEMFTATNASSATKIFPARICSSFSVESQGLNTFKVYSKTPDTNSVYLSMDGTAASNNRNATMTIKGKSHNVSRPVINDMVSTITKAGQKIYACSFDSSGNTLRSYCDDWIVSTSPISEGYMVNTSNIDMTKNTCSIAIEYNYATDSLQILNSSQFSIQSKLASTGAYQTTTYHVTCIGEK